MKNKYDNFLLSLQASLAKWILYFFYKTNKWDVRGSNNFKLPLKNKKSIILSCWHGQLLTPFMHLMNKKFYGLAGLNKDGELISRIGIKLGWKMLRGSSSKGGSKIFVEIVKILRQPSSLIGITPDGPKGPERVPKRGVIKAAQKTGALIIPVSAISTKNWQFINWHTFYLEKPFGKIYITYGEPIHLKKNMNLNTCINHFLEKMKEVEENNLYNATK